MSFFNDMTEDEGDLAAGVATGAASGAVAGSFVPGVGTAIGAGVGAAFGAVSVGMSNRQNRKAVAAAAEARKVARANALARQNALIEKNFAKRNKSSAMGMKAPGQQRGSQAGTILTAGDTVAGGSAPSILGGGQ